MNLPYSFLMLAVMALVTYLVRMVPLTFFNKRITNRFLKSFLYYVTYAVLGAMTFPEIFFSTGSLWSGLSGAAALLLAFLGQSLLTVALSACGAALVVNIILLLF